MVSVQLADSVVPKVPANEGVIRGGAIHRRRCLSGNNTSMPLAKCD